MGPASLLALLLAACGSLCPQPRDSAERAQLRARLGALVHVSQCPGPPTPTAFESLAAEESRREQALLERIARSPVAQDLEQVQREDEAASRFVNESDCAMTFWNTPDDPANVRDYRAQLDARRAEVRSAEAAFRRAVAGCARS